MKKEYPQNDNEYKEHGITKVSGDRENGWELSLDTGWCFFCPKDSPIIPARGMIARMYPGGFGGTVRGLFINGVKVFYLTDAEQQAKNKQDVIDSNNQKKAEFETNKESYFAKIKTLPECFQKRIAKFQGTNPDYDWKFGDYELFCCEQAVIIANTLKTIEAIQIFHKQSWKEQKITVPALGDGHSGNTFGFSISLAHHYITNQENVIKEHGALTPLVGCKEYGCPHVG
jgi:hypothetical protein